MIDADEPQDDDTQADDDLVAAEQHTVSAARPGLTRSQVTRRQREQREQAQFWTVALSTEIGRREIWRLLDAGHPFETRYGVGPNGFPQVEATWLHRGEQDFALRLFFTLQRIDPEGVLLMQTEHDPRFAHTKTPARKRKAD